MVSAPANTGKERSNKIEVKKIDQEKREISSLVLFILEKEKKVLIKLIAPAIEETPAKWREKIPKSLETEGLNKIKVKGGYKVHPAPTPSPITLLKIRKNSETGRSQNLKLLSRGKDISGRDKVRGITQLPRKPSIIGITKKKIIIKA